MNNFDRAKPGISTATVVGKKDTIENVQAMRGIAALLVVWVHLRLVLHFLSPATPPPPLFNSLQGAIGVDLFFIISGYVISLAACKRHSQPLDFFLARVARVSPLYLASFVLVPFSNIVDDPPFSGWPAMTIRSVWNGVFYLPILDFGDYRHPPLGVGWTLSFEMWFYVAFALLLHLWKPAKVALFLPIIFFVGAILMTLFYHGAWYFPRFMFHPFVLEFALGCVIFQAQPLISRRLSWFLIALGVIGLLAFSRHAGYLGGPRAEMSTHLELAWRRVLQWGLPVACIAAGLVGLERNHRYVLPRALVWVGGISYSLYLTHLFSLSLVAHFGQAIGLRGPMLVAPLGYAVSILVAWVCWKWVEKPLTSGAQAWAKRIARGKNPQAVSSGV